MSSDWTQKLAAWVDGLTDWTGLKHVDDPLALPRPEDGAAAVCMPGYLQLDSFSCGYVAGLMALHALYPRRSARRFLAHVAPDRETGTSNVRLVRALRAAGVAVAWRSDLDFDDLAAAFAAGRPVVTTIATEAPDTWHWVTLYGVAERPRRIFIAGCGRPHATAWREFVWLWRPRGFGLVCRRRRC